MQRAAAWGLVCSVLLAAVLPGRAPAFAEPRYDEAAVRAAMLLNLPKFIAWPAAVGGPGRLCVINAPAVYRALTELLDAARSAGRPATLDVQDRIDDSCRYSYAGDAAASAALLAMPASMHLLVSERAGKTTAPVELLRREERVVIRINHAALSASGFEVDARLLQLAEVFGGT